MQTHQIIFSSSRLLGDSSMDRFCRRIQSETLVRETHLLRKGGMGLPGGRMAGVDLFHHLVDLFEGETFGFGLEGNVSVCVAH